MYSPQHTGNVNRAHVTAVPKLSHAQQCSSLIVYQRDGLLPAVIHDVNTCSLRGNCMLSTSYLQAHFFKESERALQFLLAYGLPML